MNTVHKDPILLDFPESLETARLLIRAPQYGDGALMNEAVLESLPQLRPWMTWARSAPSLEQSEQLVREARLKFLQRTEMWLLIFDKLTGAFIGNTGLHHLDWKARKFETGYWVRTSQSGKGYVTEAVRGVTQYVFGELGGNRLEIRCDTRNERSAEVARRAGFTLEGVLRNNGLDTEGSLRSTMVFSRLKDE